VLLIAGALGCGGDPRIVATFRQGGDARGYVSRQAGAYYYYNPPTVAGGHVFVGTSRKLFEDPRPDNFFFKLDARLRKVWEVALGKDEVRGGAAVSSDGRIYFVVEKGRVAGERTPVTDFLWCLDPDGKLLWEYQLNSGEPSWDNDVGMINPAIAKDGTIYVGGEKLHALHPDGTLRWAYPPGPETLNVKNAPIIDPAGNVYFAASYGVHSLDPDGAPRWSYPNDGSFPETLSSPAFSYDHARVYVALGETMKCFDAATGTPHWSVTGGPGSFRATPAVDDQGNVYAGTKANAASTFYAIGADGTVLWRNRIGADLYSSPALGDDRTIYVGSEKTEHGQFHALDMATGVRKWSVAIGGDITWSSPALVEGGLLYVGSMNGSVYAIRSDAAGLLRNAGSARFHGGNDSTGRHE
jgi:outer membrane protein assembly factor BamB